MLRGSGSKISLIEVADFINEVSKEVSLTTKVTPYLQHHRTWLTVSTFVKFLRPFIVGEMLKTLVINAVEGLFSSRSMPKIANRPGRNTKK